MTDHSPDHAPCAPLTRDEAIRRAVDEVRTQINTKDHRPIQELADDIIAKLVEATLRPLNMGETP